MGNGVANSNTHWLSADSRRKPKRRNQLRIADDGGIAQVCSDKFWRKARTCEAEEVETGGEVGVGGLGCGIAGLAEQVAVVVLIGAVPHGGPVGVGDEADLHALGKVWSIESTQYLPGRVCLASWAVTTQQLIPIVS